jgi:hypothetical protein
LQLQAEQKGDSDGADSDESTVSDGPEAFEAKAQASKAAHRVDKRNDKKKRVLSIVVLYCHCVHCHACN